MSNSVIESDKVFVLDTVKQENVQNQKQLLPSSSTSFLSYQDELNKIWRDNVAVTNSRVLEVADECHLGSTATGLFQTAKELLIQKLRVSKNKSIETENALIQLSNCCNDDVQFITKIPDWNNSIGSKTRSKLRGS